MTDEELEAQCKELFAERPIDFEPRKGNKLDEKIAKIIDSKDIMIPI